MAKVKQIPVSENQIGYLFTCPGCEQLHAFNDKIWTWNKDFNNPTLSPSYLLRKKDGSVCHSFIVQGYIRFLSDCTHKLKGKTVGIPQYDYP